VLGEVSEIIASDLSSPIADVDGQTDRAPLVHDSAANGLPFEDVIHHSSTRNTNKLYRGRGEPGTASDKQKDPKKKNKPHKYRDHTRGQRGRETGRRATTEGRGGAGEDHEGFWPGSRLKVLCGDLWGTSLRATSGRSSTIVLQREAISPRLIRTASRPPSVILARCLLRCHGTAQAGLVRGPPLRG
jgi:hypothetical protein